MYTKEVVESHEEVWRVTLAEQPGVLIELEPAIRGVRILPDRRAEVVREQPGTVCKKMIEDIDLLLLVPGNMITRQR